jgi:hypothetical protein
MTTYYKATFSDGTVLRRSTVSRKYSHAWLAYGSTLANPQWPTWRMSGFSGTEQLARKQAAGPWANRTVGFTGIAPTVEITAKEYRAMGSSV